MRNTVRLGDIAAGGTRPGGVSGVNGYYRDARQGCLVGYEASELLEGPGVMLPTLRTPNRNSLPDTLQVFQGDAERVPSGLIHQGLTDIVINPAGEPTFLSPAFSQQPLGRPCSLSLELGPESGMTMAQAVEVAARVDRSVTIDGDVHDAQVNSKNTRGSDGCRAFHLDGLVDESPAISVDQDSIGGFRGQRGPWPENNTETQSVEGHCAPSVAVLVKGQGKTAEVGQGGTSSLVGVGGSHPPDEGQGESRFQAVCLPNFMVTAVDEGDGSEDTLLVSNLGDVVAGSIGLLYHKEEGLEVPIQPTLSGEFHVPLSIQEGRVHVNPASSR